MIESFAPIAPPGARLLILGTMPSVKSLQAAFYYAHPRNAFWPLMADILREPLPMDIAGRRALLGRHGIALWDVLRACERAGSLDSAIRNEIPNHFEAFYARCPRIERVLFNGSAAQRLYLKHVHAFPAGCEFLRMPSTSPAHTLPYAQKRAAWAAGMEGYYVDQPPGDPAQEALRR